MLTYLDARKLHPSDVLIDNISILNAASVLDTKKIFHANEILRAATFLEALVLYDRLIVDPLVTLSSTDASVGQFDKVYSTIKKVHSKTARMGIEKPIYFLRFPLRRKVDLAKSIDIVYPELGFHWESFIRKLGEDRIQNRDFETSMITSNIYEAMFQYPKGKGPLLNDDGEVIGLPSSIHYFRHSGPIAKQAYYLSLSQVLGISYAPNYERNRAFKALFAGYCNPDLAIEFLNKKIYPGDKNYQTAQAQVIKYFEESVIKPIDNLANSVLQWQGVNYPLPSVFSQIVKQSRNKKCSLLDAALEIRESTNATAFRNWCKEIQISHQEGNNKEIRKLLKGFLMECEKWSQLSENNKDPIGAISFVLFGVGISIDVGKTIKSLERRLSKHLIFLRELK